MPQPYSILINEQSPPGTVAFRDAAITYAAARRGGRSLEIAGSDQALELLSWLGIEKLWATESRPEGYGTYCDPSARQFADGVPKRYLPAWGELSNPSLQDLREQGYVPEAVFAALVRSSYGPSTPEFYPTRSELGFLFEDGQILDQVRWDQEYLEAAQSFFMEELMPAELLEKSLAVLPSDERLALEGAAEHWQEELHAITFLVCSGLERLTPLTGLLGALLTPSHLPELSRLLEAVPSWTPEAWSAAWQGQEAATRDKLSHALCPGFPDQAEAILYAAGPALLKWRTGSLSEALR